jgi:hypothetical protein
LCCFQNYVFKNVLHTFNCCQISCEQEQTLSYLGRGSLPAKPKKNPINASEMLAVMGEDTQSKA